MRTIRFLTTGILLITGTFIKGQSLSPEVIASGGEQVIVPGMGTVSFTIGELMITTYKASSQMLTQGFHQTKIIISTVNETVSEVEANVFPNPSSSEITIAITGKENVGDYRMRLFDLSGKLLLDEKINHQERKKVDISLYANGYYSLQILSTEGVIKKVYQLSKT